MGLISIIILILLVLLVFGLVVLLPIFIKYLNRHDRRLKFLLLIPVIIFGYFIYTAIYPLDNFFKQDFREVTGIEFPENGEIIYKSADYPDQFGDYASVSIVKVDKDFYETLPNRLNDKGLIEKANSHGSSELDKAMTKIGSKEIEKEFSLEQDNVFYYVAFLSDRESIIVNRSSW